MSDTEIIPATVPPERKHHSTSPSTLQYREACPGYEPDQDDTHKEASDRGTLLHDATLRTADLDKFDIPDDERGVVQKCRDFVEFLVDGLSKPLADGEERTAENSATLIQEEYMHVDDRDTTAGYLDNAIVSWDKREAIILDWKMGKNAVETTSNNLQGIAYLLALVFKIPTIEKVRVIFAMPFQGTEGTLDEHTFHRHEFEGLLTRVRIVVERTHLTRKAFLENDFETLKNLLTGRACLFCQRKATCPKAIDTFVKIGKKYDPLIVPDIVNPSLPLNPVQSGQMLKLMQVMEAIAKAYRASITNRCVNEEGFMPDGYFLSSMSHRKIVDKTKFYEVISAHLTPEEIRQATDYTFGPVEKIVKDKAPRGQKQIAVDELTAELDAHGATKQGNPSPVLKQSKEHSPE